MVDDVRALDHLSHDLEHLDFHALERGPSRHVIGVASEQAVDASDLVTAREEGVGEVGA